MSMLQHIGYAFTPRVRYVQAGSLRGMESNMR